MKRALLSAVTASIVVGAGAAYAGFRLAPGPNHILARSLAINSQIDQAEDLEILFLGDSLVERADLGRICRPGTLNAGVSGARVADLLALARKTDLRRADRIVIAVGINDAKRGARAPLDRVMADYEALIRLGKDAGASVTVTTVAPTALSQTSDFDQAYVKAFNIRLRALAGKTGARLVELEPLGRDHGYLPRDWTLDGVHLNAAGYRAWSPLVAPACAAPSRTS